MKLKLRKSNVRFKFADQTELSLGRMSLVLPTPSGMRIIYVDVIAPDVPLLFGLDVLDREGWFVNNVTSKLCSASKNWEMPIYRKHGHLYLTWGPVKSILFNRSQLVRLHKHFLHPSTDKLYNLLRKATPDLLTGETRSLLDEVSKTCHACQTYSSRPITFQVRFPDRVVFNHEVRLDLCYIDSQPVLHIVDVGTNFNAATFLKSEDTSTIWNAFLSIWACMYIGYPECMLTDQGSVFVSREWSSSCESASIHLRHTGTESHNSLGAGETYHAMLRRMYNKVTMDYPRISRDLRLALSVKAVNDTAGPDGNVPSLLVFGVLPKIPHVQVRSTSQEERMKALKLAREEYERIVARRRIQHGLLQKPPPSADFRFSPGQPVYVYRENLKHFTGPHLVMHIDEKKALVDLGERTGPRSFNISQLKPAQLPSMSEFMRETSTRAYFTEVIHPKDPRAASFDQAKRDEIEGLIERGTFRLVLRADTERTANIIPSRFVLAIKTSDDGTEVYKARFVLGGHRDKEKSSLVHNATNLRASSIRMLVALATAFGFDIWSTDINQAYLQSASELKRDVFIKPNMLELGTDELIQIVKPLYGLPESEDYWGETLTRHHLDQLRMQQAEEDFSLFFYHIGRTLAGLSGTYVDDILRTGNPSFKKYSTKLTNDAFDAKNLVENEFTFTGLRISGPLELRNFSQTAYIKRLSCLAKNSSFDMFRSTRAKLAWTTHTRPDVACAVAKLAQITPAMFGELNIMDLNKVVKHLQSTTEIVLHYPKLGVNTLRLNVYSDSSFADNIDCSSQLGHIIVLADKADRCSVLHFQSQKSRRVTRSSAAAETLSFAHAFDHAFIIKHDLERILRKKIPVLTLTDSKILFDVLTKSRYTTERRLMVDIAAARQAYNNRHIDNIALIKSEFNPADALTKIGPNNALRDLLLTNRLSHPIEQYVIERKI